MMTSLCGNWVSKPLSCTASRFCHRLRERELFLSCSCSAGGETAPEPAPVVPAMSSEDRFSRCRRCSISCCLEVSLYSWYRKAGRKENRLTTCSFNYFRAVMHFLCPNGLAFLWSLEVGVTAHHLYFRH